MSFDAETLEPAIIRILSAPGVDLQTISAKRVRHQLVAGDEAIISAEVVKEHKIEIDAIISRVFATVNSKNDGGDAEDAEAEEEEVTKPKASKASSSSSKPGRKRGKAAKSEATVSSDGEMSGNEGGKKKRRKKQAAADGDEKKPRGGLKKEYTLSQPLATLLGQTKLSRPHVVKELWAYIKQHGLQDETNKRDIICDEAMENIFKVKKINMFAMNKALGEHLHSEES